MSHRRGAGDQQDIRRAPQQPGQRDLHRGGAKPRGHVRQRRGLQRAEPAEREERHIGVPSRARSSISPSSSRCARLYWFCTQTIRVIPRPCAICFGRHVAEPDMAHKPLALEVGEDRQRRLDRALGRAVRVEHGPEIDHVQHIETEIAQIVVHGLQSAASGEKAGSQEPSAPRRAPILVTMTRSSR
jgi:hypothetical protein